MALLTPATQTISLAAQNTSSTRKNLFLVLKYTCFFLVILVLWFARIDLAISPFAIAFLFATLFMPINPLAAGIGTFVLSLFTDITHSVVIERAFACIIFIIFAYARKRYLNNISSKKSSLPPEISTKKNKIPWNIVAIIIAFIVSNILTIWNAWSTSNSSSSDDYILFYQSLISIIIGSLFLISVIIFTTAIQERKTRIPWTFDQKICACIFVTILALGLGGLESDYFSIHKFITLLAILYGVFWFCPKNTIIVAICMGLGRSFVALNLNFIAIYALLCIIVIGFKTKKPYFSVIALIVTDVVLGTYFNAYIVFNIYTLLPTLLAVGIFLATPKKIISFLDLSMQHIGMNLIGKNTINQNRISIYNRLANLGKVFSEMGKVYKGMLSTANTDEQNADAIATQVISQVCENCANKHNCKRTTDCTKEIHEGIKQTTLRGFLRGNINFLDCPAVLSMKCVRLNTLIQSLNTIIEQTAKRQHQNTILDSGKVMMSGLLDGVGRLCDKIAIDMSKGIVFDTDKASQIKEELLYKKIVASDCLITKTGNSEYNVSILVPRTDINNKDIEPLVSKICKHKMLIDGIQDTTTAGFAIITLKSAPKFAVTFGVAQIAKHMHTVCGDNYSILKITSERTLIAVCDGMGSGEKAYHASTLAMSLVENFYKAGFPSEVIMSNVNQLLTITGNEIFSTIDIAVFNLNQGEVDFIKVGGVDGYIKRKSEVEVIEAGSLPLGIVDEMKPKITHASLSSGDFVILASDGIIDAFANDNFGLANFINNLTVKSPQQLADEIMQEVLNRGGKLPADDSTIVVALLT